MRAWVYKLLTPEERAALKARAMDTPYLDKMLKLRAVKIYRNKEQP